MVTLIQIGIPLPYISGVADITLAEPVSQYGRRFHDDCDCPMIVHKDVEGTDEEYDVYWYCSICAKEDWENFEDQPGDDSKVNL